MQGFSHFTVSEIEMWLNQSNLTDGLFLLENVLLYPTISGPLEARKYCVIVFISIISLAFPFILERWRRDGWWVGLWTGEGKAELGGWLESVREGFWGLSGLLLDYLLLYDHRVLGHHAVAIFGKYLACISHVGMVTTSWWAHGIFLKISGRDTEKFKH